MTSGLSRLVNEVADLKTIDVAWMLETGAPAGQFGISDEVGLETALEISKQMPGADDPETTIGKITAMLADKIAKGESGRLAGKGF